jgi:hypothetical protein
MHEVLHVAILVSVLVGAGTVVVMLAWPLFAEAPLPPATRRALGGVGVVGLLLLLVEWGFVH